MGPYDLSNVMGMRLNFSTSGILSPKSTHTIQYNTIQRTPEGRELNIMLNEMLRSGSIKLKIQKLLIKQ